MAIVTISRQLGSGGEEIGPAVARALGIPYIDREIVQQAAARAGVETALAAADREHERLLTGRVIGLVLLRDPGVAETESLAAGTPMGARHITQATYRRMLEEVVREVADQGQAVIADWGGQLILRHDSRVLRVHLYAPLAARVERVAAQQAVPVAEAASLVAASDQEHAEYARVEYGVDWQSPDLYDLTINTSRLTSETAVALIVAAVRARQAGPGATLAAQSYQDYYTPREAAELLLLNAEVIRHAVYAGELPAIMMGRGAPVIHRHDLLEWLKRQQSGG
jgi:excisionase family DNA binding protein